LRDIAKGHCEFSDFVFGQYKQYSIHLTTTSSH